MFAVCDPTPRYVALPSPRGGHSITLASAASAAVGAIGSGFLAWERVQIEGSAIKVAVPDVTEKKKTTRYRDGKVVTTTGAKVGTRR